MYASPLPYRLVNAGLSEYEKKKKKKKKKRIFSFSFPIYSTVTKVLGKQIVWDPV